MYRTDVYNKYSRHQMRRVPCRKKKKTMMTLIVLWRLMKQVISTHLKKTVWNCAKYECQGCRIDHPSQKYMYRDMCLWTSARELIDDYGCHDPLLECLNIYDVMDDFDKGIWCLMLDKGTCIWCLMILVVVRPTWVYLLDFFCSGIKHLCVLINIWTKGEVGAVKPV